MKIKNYGKILALSLAIGLATPLTNAFASEDQVKIQNINTLENFDQASKNEIEAYNNLIDQKINDSNLNPDLEKNLQDLAGKFGQEYKIRYDLKANIVLINKIDGQNFAEVIKDSKKILNGDDLGKITDQNEYLKLLIRQNQKENPIVLSDDEIKNIENETKNFIDNGILFTDENTKKNENLEQNIKSIENSKAYYLADKNLKAKYDELLKLARENKENEKAKQLLNDFLLSPDKENYQIPETLISYDETEIKNQDFIAGNTDSANETLLEEIQTIENPSQNSGSSASQNESAFLKNDKTSSKYKELSDAQKREVDAIDTNDDGIISDSELDASANYTADLGSDSWLYPFTEKSINETGSAENQNEQQAENTNTQENPSSTENTEQKQPPKTVTIDNETKAPELKNDTEEKPEEKEESQEKFNESQANQNLVPKENTNAASVVKTGIESLGYVVAILVIALGAYYFLNKNQKNKK
ncbi:hypothetical protein ACCQ41_07325 [Anaerococcus sp. ENR0831]|uniref:EF-hand domain-containing protein n=1 Tax=Anaerococcus martiniensis TaxID=3115615 RepID=A0ABW9MAR0_9FIRM